MSPLHLTANPVLRRELIERWRGRRATWVITAYVLLLSGVTLLLYWVGREFIEQQARWGGGAAFASGPTMGRFLFENLLALVLLLVLFIGPGYAASQISGERERRTLALLQITLVRPVQMAAGKLGASLAWLLLLIVAALPFAATAFFLGGITVGDLARGLVMVVGVAVSVAAMGLGISAVTRRTTASVVLTYALVLVLLLGTLFSSLVEAAVQRFDVGGGWRPVSLYANPYYGLADAVRAANFVGDQLPSVLTPFGAALPQQDVVFMGAEDVGFERGVAVGGGVGLQPMPAPIMEPREADVARTAVWLRVLAVYLTLGAGGFLLAASRLRVGHGPKRKDKRGGDEERVVTAGAAPPPMSNPTSVAPPPPPQPGP